MDFVQWELSGPILSSVQLPLGLVPTKPTGPAFGDSSSRVVKLPVLCVGALNLLPSYPWQFLPGGSSLSRMPFLSPSLHLPAISGGHHGQGFLRSCLHHRLLVHLGALPHHCEVRDATHLSTAPGPWTSAQRDVCSTGPLPLELAGSRGVIYSQERGRKPLFFSPGLWVVRSC